MGEKPTGTIPPKSPQLTVAINISLQGSLQWLHKRLAQTQLGRQRTLRETTVWPEAGSMELLDNNWRQAISFDVYEGSCMSVGYLCMCVGYECMYMYISYVCM